MAIVLRRQQLEAGRPEPHREHPLHHHRFAAAQKTHGTVGRRPQNDIAITEPIEGGGSDNGRHDDLRRAVIARPGQERTTSQSLPVEDLDPVALDELEADRTETLGRFAEARDHRGGLADGRPIGLEFDRGDGPDPKGEPDPATDERPRSEQRRKTGSFLRGFACAEFA